MGTWIRNLEFRKRGLGIWMVVRPETRGYLLRNEYSWRKEEVSTGMPPKLKVRRMRRNKQKELWAVKSSSYLGGSPKCFCGRQTKHSKEERKGQCVKCCKKEEDRELTVGFANMVVTDDFDENCLWRAVDESLIEVDSKDRRIESETGKYKHLF